jgi:hypothetical protein
MDVDPIDQVLGELPLPAYVTAGDAQLAVRAVVVHAPQEWPAGTVCRNDGATYPCRLHRWGHRVLRMCGLSEAEVADIAERGDPSVVPTHRIAAARR